MLRFSLSAEAVELAKNLGIDEKIFDLEKKREFSDATAHIHMQDDLEGWMNELKTEKFYDQDKDYFNTLKAFISGREKICWKKGADNPKEVELLMSGDALSKMLFLGIAVSYAFKQPPNYKDARFNSVSEMIGILGAYMYNYKDTRETSKEYRWNSVEKSFHNLIENNRHQDTYVHQYDTSIGDIIDPFGNNVRYKIMGSDDSRLIYIDAGELPYLMMMLKYADALGMHDEISDEMKRLGEQYEKTNCVKSSDIYLRQFLDDEIARADDENNINSPSYEFKSLHAYINPSNELLIGSIDVTHSKLLPRIKYSRDDVLPAIKGIMTTNANGGRSNIREMAHALKIYSSTGF
ncbi:MAG: hypothetical protein ACP5NV_02510 [Candidatus Woesearchaeota archaeon]